jgi:hypothetical protein
MRLGYHHGTGGSQASPGRSRSGGERSEPQRSERPSDAHILVFLRYPITSVTMSRNLRPRPTPSRTHSSRIGFPQLANNQSGETNLPFVSAQKPQSHFMSHEGFSHKTLAPAPSDLAIAPHPPEHQFRRIFQQHHAWARTAFRSINFCRSALPQSFVRSNFVVGSNPPLAAPPLSARVAGNWPRRFGFVHPVHLFVTPILFRMSGRYEFAPHPQSRPPGTQARKPRWPGRSEWSPIIRADNLGIPVAREQSHKNPASRPPTLIGQQSYSQQITTEQIAHRQGLDPATVLCSKPALEIDCPNLVASPRYGQSAWLQARTSRRTPAGPTAQFHSLHPFANRAGSRNGLPGIFPTQMRGQFSTSPTSMAPVQTANPTQPSHRSFARRTVGTATSIAQPGSAFLLKSLFPFVADLAAPAKNPTQLRHASLGLQDQLYKLKPPHDRGHFLQRHAPEIAEK